jgi:predicted amidohydrolase YtcJ
MKPTSQPLPEVFPSKGLREAHAHVPSHGRALRTLNLSDCTSREEFLGRLERLAIEQSGQRGRGESPIAWPWIIAHGVRVEGWTDPRWPTLAEFDRITGNRPACVMSFDYHCVFANTNAMRTAGLRDDSPDPAGGVICRDSTTNRPTGVLLETAAYQVWGQVPEPSSVESRESVLTAIADLRTHGFVEVHDLKSPPWLGPMLAELDDAGELSMPVCLYAPIEEFEQAVASAKGWTRDRVRLAGAKIFCDGTLNSRTAWMLHPYRNPIAGMSTGKVIATPAQIRDAMERTSRLGLQLAVHAIGDGAVRAVLDEWEGVQTRRHRGIQASGQRWGLETSSGPGLRIEHCELIDEADVPRFANLGVIASVQPCHLLMDIEVLRRQLPHRLDRVLPLRDLIDSGCTPGELLWFGSDVPIVRPDPSDSVIAATKRRRAGMADQDAIGLAQSIGEAEAIASFRAA